MKSQLFYSNDYNAVKRRVLRLMNRGNAEELGISNSHREAGDRIARYLAENFEEVIGDFAENIEKLTSSQRIANVVFDGRDGMKYHINFMAHNAEKNSRPNVTAVERLKRLYNEDDKNIFVILLLTYRPVVEENHFVDINFLPIEFIAWDSLELAALGLGQIQIQKIGDITETYKNNRREWMKEFALNLNRFYIKQSSKLLGYMKKSLELHDEWEEKRDIWS